MKYIYLSCVCDVALKLCNTALLWLLKSDTGGLVTREKWAQRSLIMIIFDSLPATLEAGMPTARATISCCAVGSLSYMSGISPTESIFPSAPMISISTHSMPVSCSCHRLSIIKEEIAPQYQKHSQTSGTMEICCSTKVQGGRGKKCKRAQRPRKKKTLDVQQHIQAPLIQGIQRDNSRSWKKSNEIRGREMGKMNEVIASADVQTYLSIHEHPPFP